MNRYRTYLDDKPKPVKKTREQIATDVATFMAAGKQVAQVPRGASAWKADTALRPKERTKRNQA
jgi:hypothetical protein